MNRYREGKYLGYRTLFYEYEQIQPNGLPTILKRQVVRKLSDHEKVVNGELVVIEDQSPDE